MENKTPRWGTLAEAAQYWGVSQKTIRRRLTDGSLEGRRIGPRMLRVNLNDIDALGRTLTVGGWDGE